MSTESLPPISLSGKQKLWRAGLAALGYAAGFVVLLTVTFLLLGVAPKEGLIGLWTGAFGDAQSGRWYPISETLLETTPLLLTGLGVGVAWRTGLFSIGGEGQLLMGALAATALVKPLQNLPAPLVTLTMLITGTLAGAFWGLIAGWLKVRRNVQEVISTIMLNYLALSLVQYAVSIGGPLQEPNSPAMQSSAFPDSLLFARLLPQTLTDGIGTRLHSGVILAFLCVPVIAIFLHFTVSGFGMKVVGQNAEAARTARFDVDKLRLKAMAISGGLCGLAGVIQLLGVSGRLYSNFSPGWGFTAIPVALLGGLSPLGTLFSALFFGALTAGSGNLARFSGVSSVLISILQAVAVLAVVGIRAWRAKAKGGEAA